MAEPPRDAAAGPPRDAAPEPPGDSAAQPPRNAAAEPAPTAATRELAIALAREFLHGCGALRVSIALDARPPAIVECTRLGPVVVHEEGGAPTALPHDVASSVALPALPFMHRVPPFDVDPATGAIAGALGGLEMLGRAVRDIAALLPGASVVAAELETTDPGAPLGLAGRPGEPVVVLAGELELELDC